MSPVILTHVGVGITRRDNRVGDEEHTFLVTAYAAWLPRVGSVTICSICEPSRPLVVEPTRIQLFVALPLVVEVPPPIWVA